MEKELSKKTSLWLLGLSPLIWSLHFLFAYIFAAVWCAKFAGRGGELQEVRIAIAGFTFICLLIVGREIIQGYKKHEQESEGIPHDDDSPEDRERFLGLTRLLISSLSFIAISYTAYVAWFFRSCV